MVVMKTLYAAIFAFALVLAPMSAHAALGDNLQAYWKLDESSGNASDSTANANTLTNNNASSYAAGIINNGVSLTPASSQYLSRANGSITGLKFTGAFTLAGWVKLSAAPDAGNNVMVSRWGTGTGRSYLFYLFDQAGTKKMAMDIFDSGGTIGEVIVNWTPVTNTWYHVALVYTAAGTSDVLFYVNGVQQGATGSTGRTSVRAGSHDFEMGGDHDGGNGYFPGMLDEWGAWDRALSSTEISQLYNNGTGFSYPFSAAMGAAIINFFTTWW